MANKLNGTEYSIFGLGLWPGSTDALLNYPERKDSTSHDYENEDGIYIDLGEPKFKARDFQIKCSMTATGATEGECFTNFWLQYNAFFTELSKPGLHDFYFDDHARSYMLFYKKMDTVKKLTRLSGQLKVGMIFNLTISEADPNQNIEKVYLVDHAGRFLIC